jgi:predicted transcriptional regulator
MMPLKIRMNRERIEIVAAITTVAAKGALKTHIMYKSNLSHIQMEKYLNFLTINGLIEEIPESPENGPRQYRTTDKGILFLKDYQKLARYFAETSENQGL